MDHASTIAASALERPFGTLYADKMAICHFKDGKWTDFKITPLENMSMHPASHVFHYSSTCFEGLKAHRQEDGGVAFFRLDRHLKRFQQSARLLCLPEPEYAQTETMIRELVAQCKDWVPPHPGALYVRPTLIGTLQSIGAAAGPSTEACLFVILSPVGSYFRGGLKPLRLLIEEETQRTSSAVGKVKTGGNYASALRLTMEARKEHQVDQVLFAPGGDVQETGAANFLLINDNQVMTKSLDSTFLHGVTRDSILQLAGTMGYETIERPFTVDELMAWIPNGEAALSGTAAVLAGVGEVVRQGQTHKVGTGEFGLNTNKLRTALVDIQQGRAEDPFGWVQRVD